MRENLLDCVELTDALDRLFGNVGTGGDVDIKSYGQKLVTACW